MSNVDPTDARRAWHGIEAINAVTYFTQERREAAEAVGLRGFFMGYFAFRAAPMGAVTSSVVEATFYNFHPDRVRRAIPDAWDLAPPESLLDVRANAAEKALRRIVLDIEHAASDLLPLLQIAIDAADGAARPLFAANRDVVIEEPVGALWQATTTLREHRGDGHLALLADAELDGCEVHLILAATEPIPGSILQASRGWSDDEWSAATDRLVTRGLLNADGTVTSKGAALHAKIEQRTDELALHPYVALGDARFSRLRGLLTPIRRTIFASNELSFPNPMGLPDQS